MTYLRHASRHVHHTVANYVAQHLELLDWTDAASTPFGAKPVRIQRTPSVLGDKLADGVTAGVVSITLGDEYGPDPEELGGALSSQEYPLFIDIFQDTHGAALALANDVRDILLARLPGTQRWLDVINQSTGAVVPGWKLELEDIDRVSPETVMPLRWQVVKLTATAYFPEVTF